MPCLQLLNILDVGMQITSSAGTYGPPKGFPFLESGQNSIFLPINRKEPMSAPSVGVPDTKWSSLLLYVVVVAGPCANQTEASICRGSYGSGPFCKRLCNTKSPKSLPQHLVVIDGDLCSHSTSLHAPVQSYCIKGFIRHFTTFYCPLTITPN
jgi:hypothetical protein